MKNRKALALSVAILLIATCTALVSAAEKAGINQPAPAFTLQNQDGKAVSLSDYAGKIVVLEWVNPECPFVKRHYEAKTMVNLASKYAPQNVVWLAINSTSHADNAANKDWVTKNSLPYAILNDSAGEVGRAYGAKTTPDMFIIDTTGKLVYRGAIDDDPRGDKTDRVNFVDKALGELLANQPVTISETKSYGCGVKYK